MWMAVCEINKSGSSRPFAINGRASEHRVARSSDPWGNVVENGAGSMAKGAECQSDGEKVYSTMSLRSTYEYFLSLSTSTWAAAVRALPAIDGMYLDEHVWDTLARPTPFLGRVSRRVFSIPRSPSGRHRLAREWKQCRRMREPCECTSLSLCGDRGVRPAQTTFRVVAARVELCSAHARWRSGVPRRKHTEHVRAECV